MRRPAFYMDVFTPDDVEDAARDLAWLIEQHAEETAPGLRQMLADWIEIDSAWLAEMREAVFPSLPFVLPLGLPAPRPEYRQ